VGLGELDKPPRLADAAANSATDDGNRGAPSMTRTTAARVLVDAPRSRPIHPYAKEPAYIRIQPSTH
jgi:hypothetical protein